MEHIRTYDVPVYIYRSTIELDISAFELDISAIELEISSCNSIGDI